MLAGKNGVTEATPKNIIFGAGTIHKNLKFDTDTKQWNFNESIMGATQGGSKISITPELADIEVDGASVGIKGLKLKVGEKAEMEVNFLELSPEIIKAAVIGKDGTSADDKYDLVQSKGDIEEGDYWDNIAFVGRNLAGKFIIVIMENALCTSGFESEGKNKEAGVGKFTFECTGNLDSELDTLPYFIYYPKVTG